MLFMHLIRVKQYAPILTQNRIILWQLFFTDGTFQSQTSKTVLIAQILMITNIFTENYYV